MDHQEKNVTFSKIPKYASPWWTAITPRKIIVFRVNNTLFPQVSKPIFKCLFMGVVGDFKLLLASPNVNGQCFTNLVYVSPAQKLIIASLFLIPRPNPQIYLSHHTPEGYSMTLTLLQCCSYGKLSSKFPVKWHVNTFPLAFNSAWGIRREWESNRIRYPLE